MPCMFSFDSEPTLNTFLARNRGNEPGDQFESSVHSVLRFDDPSNVGRSLHECNKDHLLNQARSELVKQEHQVRSLYSCINELQQQTYAQRKELQDAHHGCVEFRREQSRLQEELVMKERALRDTQIRRFHEMGEMKKAQEQRVDEFSFQKLRESHDTIQRLTSQMQEMQEQMNSMNDSGEIQEVESNHSGRLSHVPSQPAGNPSPRSMLSCDKTLAIGSWNLSGPQEHVFGNHVSTFDSSQNHHQGIHHCTTPRETGSVPQTTGTGTSFARDEERIKGTIPMPTFARRPSTMSSLFPVDLPQSSTVGQQRQQISELKLDKFPTFSTFFCWKIRFGNQVTTCSDFPSEALLWIKEVEMVDSMNELKSSRSVAGKKFPNFEMLDAKIASALNKVIQNSHFKKKGQSGGTKSPKRGPFPSRKTDRFHGLRLLSSHWRS